ncbi:putative bifunctional diguanylate cyclase/phosphodiesterase [Hahella sp. NBU794]|uniref:putative bifunctional diguanylate cyclase/phosphodiesterase n=1 Tax=Hahella sp. NBU794 TaxID=3422590 RepID=UPI003D6E9C91
MCSAKNKSVSKGFIPPPIPDNEALRLKDLESLKILDTDAEERFDRITALIADVFDAPIVLLSLVDRDRQWFKSIHGLNVPETSREISFCGHAIFEPEAMVVEDAHDDPRFCLNPLVTGEPNIRFYAGAVIRGPSGLPVGTCCLIDRKPRKLSERDRKRLLIFAKLLESELLQSVKLTRLQQETVMSAYFDPLTGLPNQRLFLDRLEQRLKSAGRLDSVTVCVVNICRFSNVISARGKDNANKALVVIGKRIKAAIKNKGSVARLSGDRFAVFTNKSKSARYERTPGHLRDPIPFELNDLFNQPVDVGGVELHLEANVGVTSYPHDGEDATSLLENAARCSKSVGACAHVQYYSQTLSDEASKAFAIEQRLRSAIANQSLHLHYQPIIDLKSGRLQSLEALLRWRDETLGNVSPADFIPVAEATGAIAEIGRWVVEEVCSQLATWKRQYPDQLVPVTINLSTIQLMRSETAQEIESIVTRAGVDSALIQLEVTESCFLKDFDSALCNMKKMLELGFKFLIDDFGTGFSSLSYLNKLPLHKLKLDRSFVSGIDHSDKCKALAKHIIALSQELGLIVVAEGVEDAAQARILTSMNCDQAQGYLYSRPLPPAEISQRFFGV